ncbi:hypothetical protein SEA_POSH_38 [Gordonia phage Posh]|nr:hypothetical protein SEA_POSH_38 [Gordonia phage Posh]UOW93702.1 hypothetical protein SEA_WRIGLEY_39 [Gordonia phage Wrigley]
MVFIGQVSIGGVDADGNEFHDLPAMPLDQRVAAKLSKRAIEDQQFLSMVLYAELAGAMESIQSYRRPASDPPDLIVTTASGADVGVELTSISATDITRQRFADIRRIGRSLSERFTSDPKSFEHLVGRVVFVAEMGGDDARPKRRVGPAYDALIDALADAVKTDIGIAQGIPPNPDGTMPLHVPRHVMQQGRVSVEEYDIEVQQAPDLSAAPVATASVQAYVETKVLDRQFLKRIDDKDIEANDVLLISTGLPDPIGYVCPVDHWIYYLITERIKAGKIRIPVPRHLNQIVLNHWGDPASGSILYARPGTPHLIHV